MPKPDPFAVCRNLGSGSRLLDPYHEIKQVIDVAWLCRYGKHAGVGGAGNTRVKATHVMCVHHK